MAQKLSTELSSGSGQGLPVFLWPGVLLLLLLSSFWFVYAATPEAGDSIAPIIPQAKGEQCVADTDLMRTDHMKLLNHQRDETVIEGIRGEPFSLVGCVNCHAQTAADGTALRIDAEGQFCQSCHAFAAVKIDCFTCHAAVPEASELIGLKDPAIGHEPTADMMQLARHLSMRDNFTISADPYIATRHKRPGYARKSPSKY